jgi:hypothetical protein
VTCRKGLHELDPDDRAPNGSRCRECYLATHRRYNGTDKGVRRYEEWFERHYYSDDLQDRLWAQKRAMRNRRFQGLQRVAARYQRNEEERNRFMDENERG